MLTVSLAGFLIAKQGGFLQLACSVLHPFYSWPDCLLLGFCFLIMRLLTTNSLCLSCFFSQGEAEIKPVFRIWLPLVFVCHDINYALVLHCLATNCLQYVINSNQGSDSVFLAVVELIGRAWSERELYCFVKIQFVYSKVHKFACNQTQRNGLFFYLQF